MYLLMFIYVSKITACITLSVSGIIRLGKHNPPSVILVTTRIALN